MFWHRGDPQSACTRVERMLADRSAGLLRPGQERWLDAHLRTCESCRREARILDRVLALVDAVPPVSPPPGMWNAIQMRLVEAPIPALAARRFRMGLVPAAAAAGVLVAAALAGVYQRPSAPPPFPTFPPESLAYIQRHEMLAHTEPFANHVGLVSFESVAGGGSQPAEGITRW